MNTKASSTTQGLLQRPEDREAMAIASRYRVSVMGCGVISPAVQSAGHLLYALRAGVPHPTDTRRRLLPLDELHAVSELRPREVKKVDRFSLLAITAARAALREAGLKPDAIARCGIVTGNMMCGWTFTEPEVRALHDPNSAGVSPYLATAWFPAAPQGQVTIHLKMQGFAKTITTDRCAGAQAIGLAFDRIRYGRSDMLLAGGVEAPVTPFVEAAFGQLQQAPENLVEAAAYLLLAADGTGQITIGAHETFPVAPLDGFSDDAIEQHLSAFVRGLPECLPISTVVCNVAASHATEEKIASAIASAFPGNKPRILYPTRAIGDCLAASGALAAAFACMALGECEGSCSTLVLSLGHQCADLLWIYKQL
jgi:3-oxoacyl-(acyl-carrier-protein) synthase